MARRSSFVLLAAGSLLSACGVGNRATGTPVVTPPDAMQQQTFDAPSQDEIDQFSEELTRRTFQYFWDTTDTQKCLAPDRWPTRTASSIAATGFAITAYGIGAERGYVSREDAAERTRDCLQFYWSAPQGEGVAGITGHRGFFYHFLTYEDGTRSGTSELSTIDTALFLGGSLFAQSYYDRDIPAERDIRELSEKIYARVEWDWAQRSATGTEAENLEGSHGITMGWRPERGWEPFDWIGYDEGMLVYVLALGSPTQAVAKNAWEDGWARGLDDQWGSFYGYEHLQFGPLFGHQYSHVWIDFRGIQDDFMRDKGIDYFENSRRATLSQRAYGIDNPNDWKDYSGNIWGWTASDGPGNSRNAHIVNGERRSFWTYTARGVSGIQTRDDGTIVPTAAGGSVPFAPEVAIPALMAMKAKYGNRLYTRYGFKDAFNPSYVFPDAGSSTGTVDQQTGWVSTDYLGIDQGPMLAMMENHRSGLIWRTMRKNPHIRRGLQQIGFREGWLEN